MNMVEALEIVLELAIENALEEWEAKGNNLEEHYKDQQEALEKVQQYIDRWKAQNLHHQQILTQLYEE